MEGIKYAYDACHEGDLEKAKKWYGNNFKYIGSGYTYYINGTKNVSKKLHHFFVYKKPVTII